MPSEQRPTCHVGKYGDQTIHVVYPSDASSVELLGYFSVDGVALTLTQVKKLSNLYGFHIDTQPTSYIEGGSKFLQTGSFRNLSRWVSRDGIRMVAAIAPFLDPHEDPVRLLLDLMTQAGYDVPAWEEGPETDSDRPHPDDCAD